MKNLLAFLVAILSIIACSVDDEPVVVTNELIIGVSYGECAGDCAFLYLLKDDQVFEDDGVDRVGNPEDLTFSNTPLAGIDQLRFDSLFSQLPGNLAGYETEDFGCPDCGDWGALHVIRSTEAGVYTAYVLDNATGNMTASLQPYGRLMQRSLQEFRM